MIVVGLTELVLLGAACFLLGVAVTLLVRSARAHPGGRSSLDSRVSKMEARLDGRVDRHMLEHRQG